MALFMIRRSLDGDHVPAEMEGSHFRRAEFVYRLGLMNYLGKAKIEAITGPLSFGKKAAAACPFVPVIEAANHHTKRQRTEPQRTRPSIITIPSHMKMRRRMRNLSVLGARVLKANWRDCPAIR
jgi:hypothetical protein